MTQAFLVFGFLLMGATFGPMGAVLPELFPTNVRYSGSAISYNVSSFSAPRWRRSSPSRSGRPPAAVGAGGNLSLGDVGAHI